MNFNTFDLNLVRVFDALFKEQSVTRAGARLGLSQPAVSAALRRLRVTFEDELFVRRGQRMVPTPRAEDLAKAMSGGLALIKGVFDTYREVDLARLQRSYTLMGADFFSSLFMPRLSMEAARAAPGVRLRLVDASSGDIASLLQEGMIDVALEHLPEVPPWVSSRPLFRSCFVVVARPDHLRLAGLPGGGAALPPEMLAELSFAVYSLDGGESGCAVDALRMAELDRRVMLALPHFQATVQAAAADRGLAALVPCQFADAAARQLGLVIHRLGVGAPVVDLAMHWHRRSDDDPQHRWLRELIAGVIDALDFDGCAARYLPAPAGSARRLGEPVAAAAT